MRAAGVSRETRAPELGIYGRLIEWAVWATDRRDIPQRLDDVAGDFRLTDLIRDRIAVTRRKSYPLAVQPIEKAVARLPEENDGELLRALVVAYFLNWQKVSNIADVYNLTEHHVVEYLHRAMRILARRIAELER